MLVMGDIIKYKGYVYLVTEKYNNKYTLQDVLSNKVIRVALPEIVMVAVEVRPILSESLFRGRYV